MGKAQSNANFPLNNAAGSSWAKSGNLWGVEVCLPVDGFYSPRDGHKNVFQVVQETDQSFSHPENHHALHGKQAWEKVLMMQREG